MVAPRRKPTSVRPVSSAREAASEEGADTAASTGTPIMTAFCASSNEARPLTSSTWPASGSRPRAQRPAGHLIHRVVPAHILAQHEQGAVRGEQAGRVQAAGAAEHALRVPEPVRQAGQHGRGDPDRIRGHIEGGPGPDRLDAVLAAHPARAGGEEVPGRRLRVGPGGQPPSRLEGHRRDVLVAHPDLVHVIQPEEQALGEQEAGGQIDVVTWSAHRHGERRAVHPDRQRFLGREQIGPVLRIAGYRHPQHSPPRRVTAHMAKVRHRRKA